MNSALPAPISSAPEHRTKSRRLVVAVLGAWTMAVPGFILFAVWNDPVHRAVLGMAWGLILFWIVGCGLIMWRWRGIWDRVAAKVPLPWMLKFVLGCIALALIEEAITTSMTNAAPLFGVRLGQAYITASANYLDVVFYHSVVMFVPLFAGWAVMLRFWAFSPFAVFLLFGITGTLCESITFGLQNLGNMGMWMLVYGLMVWLPARWAPPERGAKPPRWWAYPVAVVLPYVFMPLDFLLASWLWLTPKHPAIHFPPIGTG